MFSKPRAPQTAHLRKAIRKAAQRRPRFNTAELLRQNASTASKAVAPAINGVRDGVMHYWQSVSSGAKENDRIIQACTQKPPHLLMDEDDRCIEKVDAHSNTLCEILSRLAVRFKLEGRAYCAAAATAAVALVRLDRQDEINPGLWSYINKEEEEISLLEKR